MVAKIYYTGSTTPHHTKPNSKDEPDGGSKAPTNPNTRIIRV